MDDSSTLSIGAAYPFDAARGRETLAELGISADARFAPALAAAAGSAPYLHDLIARRPETARTIAREGPSGALARALASASAAADQSLDRGMTTLRQAKADVHLACAIGDLSGVWDLAAVTAAISDLAECACASALALAAGKLAADGELIPSTDRNAGPVPGFIILAMGKLGARELNYSSDIDLTLFFDPNLIPVPKGGEARRAALKLVPMLVRILEEVTSEGYVFRTDLRLRPDPGSTQVVVSVNAAEAYYQSVGQNWERAALIKARPIAGDLLAGAAFLEDIAPFVWRRHLDYAAIADIHSIKRQIRSVHAGGDLAEAAPDVKVGHGGIRDVELFVQTQQLILGGRDRSLRARSTIEALHALERAGVIDEKTRADLAEAYTFHRAVEHRIQMLADEQTHRIPANPERRARLAALCGFPDAAAFDRALAARRVRVAKIDAALFPDEESLADPLGGLVFTGVEDDPETLATLARLGFQRPAAVSAAVRGWHHGRTRATRSERAREILTELMPKLLRSLAESGDPDVAFSRFDDFLSGLPAGVQLLALFRAQPGLLVWIADALGLAPRLAIILARRPALIDGLLDPRFAQPIALDTPGERQRVLSGRLKGLAFEAALNEARRFHREEALRIGMHVLQGRASAGQAGPAYTDLAEACVGALAQVALAETERRFGPQPGAFCVVGLGKLGGAELSENSDLDIMLIYDAPVRAEGGSSSTEFYTRLTQRLISALSAPTEEGELYEIDMALRPSGGKGPPAVRLSSFERYYREDAWTWELQSLTRMRLVGGDAALGARAGVIAAQVINASRDGEAVCKDVAAMRARMDRERAGSGLWDLKLAPGGLVDIEFVAQTMMLAHAHHHPEIVHANTGAALEVIGEAGILPARDVESLKASWRLYSNLTQILRICVVGTFSPDEAPARLRARLASVAGVADFEALAGRLTKTKAAIRSLFVRLVGTPDDGSH